jgi:hypothetical protein
MELLYGFRVLSAEIIPIELIQDHVYQKQARDLLLNSRTKEPELIICAAIEALNGVNNGSMPLFYFGSYSEVEIINGKATLTNINSDSYRMG